MNIRKLRGRVIGRMLKRPPRYGFVKLSNYLGWERRRLLCGSVGTWVGVKTTEDFTFRVVSEPDGKPITFTSVA